MKKTFSIIMISVIVALSVFALVGCNETPATAEEKTVMNVACNPEVEFVLDTENKVISVNALNEEGNLILKSEVFVGQAAEDAAKLFVEAANEMGFIVEGDTDLADNEISISLSGDTAKAEEIYNSVKEKIDTYLTAENITAEVNKVAAITEEKLEELVALSAPYVDKAKIQAMEYAELVEELYKSRKETAELYSQELKNAYYQAKADAMELIELETLKSKLGAIDQIAVGVVMDIYTAAVETLEELRFNMLVKEDSPYQLALVAFQNAKVEYLNYRKQVAEMAHEEITESVNAMLASLDTAVENAEAALLSAGASANGAIDTAKSTAASAKQSVIDYITGKSVEINEHLEEIATEQQAAYDGFMTEFETSYAEVIASAEAGWESMKNQLTTPPQE